jgi:hypothetical protein
MFDRAAVQSGPPDEVLVAFHAHLYKGLAPSVYALTPRRLFDCSHLNDPKALTVFLEQSFKYESQVAMIVQP